MLDIIEPWVTPLLSTINHTRKTAIELPGSGERYMLGVFFPHDDVSLGVTRFRAGPLPAPLPQDEVADLTDEWCDAALRQLPMAVFVYEHGQSPPALLVSNDAAAAGGAVMEARAVAALEKLEAEWASAAEPGAAVRPVESWELHEEDVGSKWRSFIWRPAGSAWTAVGFCPLPEGVPPLVADHLG